VEATIEEGILPDEKEKTRRKKKMLWGKNIVFELEAGGT